ncbi:glycoside hydrolase family 18 protein, partial [Daldinia sp. EC12]
LTHLNFAFAYIAPGSFDLIPMDDQTPESLWKLSTDAKQYNPNLKVFVAIGGWTFSDNDTVTQPLFGEIASTAANRQKFADNVVRFANRYGFDGLDIDWEYPGAPDRGGKPEDTENFTLLMKTLRQTFNGSPRQLGLTFTAPSSYWYLKWFDLPGLVKYADWINLMSYDLHGTWDRNNPIGAIVQGHTNLTEIQLAAQLLWRVGIKPEQVTIGFGFYGRSFELSDPSCSKPGCRFKGGARPGPCSDTSGVLQYYEIQAILKQIPGLRPVHDEKAAVKYLVFDKNQWVSYDDAETFEQKIAWANSIGIGGSLIWAADTDDDKFTAMSGLVGKQVSHVDVQQKSLLPTVANVAANLIGQIGQECQVLKDHECRPSRDLRCEKGFSLVGWDRDGCKVSRTSIQLKETGNDGH